MNKLIIIRGNSGSGKSTVAKQLQHELGYGTMLIPQDVIRRDIIRTKDSPNNPSIQLIKRIATYGHSIGYTVIIEGILARQRYGKMLQEVASLFDTVYVYYFDIPLEETFKRHQTKSNSHSFSKAQMRDWYVEKDMLGMPNERVITSEYTAGEVVRMILGDVKGKTPG